MDVTLDALIQLDARFLELIRIAQEIRRNAYAPYSGFQVGAAALGGSGAMYCGCNVENISFGLTICAERNAVAQAVGAGETKISALALVVSGPAAFPCGACLQVLNEFSDGGNLIIIAANTEGAMKMLRLSECLPHPFTSI